MKVGHWDDNVVCAHINELNHSLWRGDEVEETRVERMEKEKKSTENGREKMI